MKFYRKYKEIGFERPKDGNAGYDIRTPIDIVIHPKTATQIATGLHLQIPDGYVGIIKDKSSVALLQGYTSAGVIDSSYRGEIIVCIRNGSDIPLGFTKNQKIAQILILPYHTFELEETEADGLEITERGSGGFGSTGKF